MKINSIGIDSYQKAMEKPQAENRMPADKNAETTQTKSVQVPNQANKIGSKLAVKLKPGAFVDMLTSQEKEAFEMVFAKFQQMGTPDGSYRNDGVINKSMVGNLVDVKL